MERPERQLTWPLIVKLARSSLERKGELPSIYRERLEFEIKQFESQGNTATWVNYFNEYKKFSTNPNRLLMPWLLGMVKTDPISVLNEEIDGPYLTSSDHKVVSAVIAKTGKMPIDIYQDADKPDIDLDCLPEARDPIKAYAQRKYGGSGELDDDARDYGYVCSVGTWQTYLLRSAIIDVYKHMDLGEKDSVLAITTQLPDEVDELKDEGKSACKNRIPQPDGDPRECGTIHDQVRCPVCGSDSTESPTIARLLQDYEVLRDFNDKHPGVVRNAVGLVGRIKTMGKHAGALIIADRQLYGNLPLARRDGKNKLTGEIETHWLSMWTEGRNTQLSKFGYNKWDILGLKNLKFLCTCCKLIESNRGVRFGEQLEGWEHADPDQVMEDGTIGSAGWFEKFNRTSGEWERYAISLNDPAALKVANDQRTDAIFQLDTPLARRTMGYGVTSFTDLMLLVALGHPGPLESIPAIVANRDSGNDEWKSKLHPKMLEILESTYGFICFQEQLAAIWQAMAGFTSPEAQDARKAVAKKWRHLLKPIEARWMAGASKTIGKEAAAEQWSAMVSFGRYAFNKCLGSNTELTDMRTGQTNTIEQWYDSKTCPHLLEAWDGGPTTDECVAIHCNGEQEVYEIIFSDGNAEQVTLQHRFLCNDGEFYSVSDIVTNQLDILNSRSASSYLKIQSIRSLGLQNTYSPEMKSNRHNYITNHSNAIHANSHALAYSLLTYKCLWLKAYYAPEYWAAVMSDCHPDKLIRYMAVAKSEGVQFATININNITINFTVTGECVNQGLIGLKKVGMSAAKEFEGVGNYKDIDEFIAAHKKNKTVLERLIKLGSFAHLPGHSNRFALWSWYLYRYGSGTEVTALRKWVRGKLAEKSSWTDEAILEERHRQISEYKLNWPNRNKIPDKILKWAPPIEDDRDSVVSLFPLDFTTPELLTFEKNFLGYYMSNPLYRYEHTPSFTIKRVKKDGSGPIHAVIMRVEFGTTKKGDEMCRVAIYDGVSDGLLLIWSDDCEKYRDILMKAQEALTREVRQKNADGTVIKSTGPKCELGVGMSVRYSASKDAAHRSFTLKRESQTLWLLPPTKVRPISESISGASL